MAEKLNPHWPVKDEARNGEWRVDDENLEKRANGAESCLLLRGPILVPLIVTCHELSPDQRLLQTAHGWCYAHMQQVCRAFSPVPVMDRRVVIKRGKPAADIALFSFETLLKFMTYIGNIVHVHPIASPFLERGRAFGTESQEHLHGAVRGLRGGDDRICIICVMEGAIQQGTLHSFLRVEFRIEMDVKTRSRRSLSSG
jgi:hypothetical protein